MELTATGSDDYQVLDSGDGLRLERLGPVVITRQAAQAVWPKALDSGEWERLAHASHFRHDDGPGEWTQHRNVRDGWPISLDGLTFELRLTGFGHIGIFAEQQAQWPWITEQLRPGDEVLNLFAYTGGSTLAAARAGAKVTHVDAVKGVVQWASKNAELSGLGGAPIRWIVDDAVKFTTREVRRGRRYQAIILDPPTFGRGPRGQVWKIESEIMALLDLCRQLLADDARFLLLSAHTPGFTAGVLRNTLQPLVAARGGALESGDMVQTHERAPYVLPAGVYCRWLG